MEVWTIIIIGASGDLSRRRLIPTLYEMLKHEKDLSFLFVGAAKDAISIEQLLTESIAHRDPALLEKLITRSTYQTIDFTDPETFSELAKTIVQQEKNGDHTTQRRLVYLAIDSRWYSGVTASLCKEGILQKSVVTHRIIYEKPFGWDTASALSINNEVTHLLDEDQIYRVDHYISKALVTSLLTTRLSNVFFEPILNSDYVDQVQIILSEKDTLEKRGLFYDRYGTLKDVVQNHMLQLLACIGMEKPPSLDHESVTEYKKTVLREIKVIDGLLGQFHGYRDIPGVSENSTRETYALLRAEITTPRWHKVPFYLKTGKALDYKSTEIHIVFKPQKLADVSIPFESNRLIIRISPDSALLLRLNAQKIREPELVPVSLEFCYRCTFGAQPHSYETLFHDVMKGDKSVAVTFDEIEYAWECISQIEKLKLPLYSYKVGSSGPLEAEEFSHKHAIMWAKETTRAEPSNT